MQFINHKHRSFCVRLSGSEQLLSPGGPVKLQDRMLLDCSCPWSGNLIMVSWTKGGDSTPLAVYHPDFGVNFNTAYDGRVEFIHASKMDGSIRITNVSEKDEGVYHCSVQTFPQGSWTKDTLVQKQGMTHPRAFHRCILDTISSCFCRLSSYNLSKHRPSFRRAFSTDH